MILLRPLVMLAIIVTGVKSDFLSSNCDTTSNYTTNSTYKANLDKLQSSLLSSVITSGFSNDTIGQYPDQVFGLALCRGDLSAEGCQTCIQSTFSEVPTDCPYGKNERIWYSILNYVFFRKQNYKY
jgi:Salt stress response/antifungal